MKKVEFYASTGYVGCERQEIVEFDDDATKDEIEEEFQCWLDNYCDIGWNVIEDDNPGLLGKGDAE